MEKKRSAVWTCFNLCEHDEFKVICSLCGESVIHSGNTSNMFRHLERNHHDKFIEVKTIALHNPMKTKKDPDDPSDGFSDSSKRGSYHKRYCSKWEQQPEFQEWIKPSPHGEEYAYCRACRIHVKARSNVIRKHRTTIKHRKYMKIMHESGDDNFGLPESQEHMDVEFGEEDYVIETLVGNGENMIIKPMGGKLSPKVSSYKKLYKQHEEVNNVNTSSSSPGASASMNYMFSDKNMEVEKDVAAFAQFIAVELSSIKDTYTRNIAKFKVHNLVMEIANEHINNSQMGATATTTAQVNNLHHDHTHAQIQNNQIQLQHTIAEHDGIKAKVKFY